MYCITYVLYCIVYVLYFVLHNALYFVVTNPELTGGQGVQSQKMRKLSEQQDFCRKNFLDKARKSRQFSNSRQMCIKGGFTRFCA